MTTLVVVESPSKAKKIGAMLGAGYVVQASGGHIRDLTNGDGDNGYDPASLEPRYEVTERGKESVKWLKGKNKDCSEVLLATDPDREGEAIGWHVAEVLGIKARRRVKFHEISNAAILAAINNPTPLDTNLVRAQEARRVIDRMVGWLVSGPLAKTIGEKASAGRVQSPSLGLVVEREREIRGFVKEQYFTAAVSFAPGWSADWLIGEGEKCKVRADAERAAASRTFVVREFVERDESEAPPAPFDTAVMQQAASVQLGFDPEKTMQVAQKLFEGHGQGGFITYHRTDDVNLSDDAFAMIQSYAQTHSLPVVSSKRKWKAAAGAQEAHEAIRPTHFFADTSDMDADEKALFELIRRRAIASQLADCVSSVRRAVLDSAGLKFTAVGKVVKDKGWRGFGDAAEIEKEEDSEEIPANPVPALAVGDTVTATGGTVKEGWTRAPGRYTKASLVKTLKALGIGRPATYAAAVDGLEKRAYVTLDGKRRLLPTAVAEKIYDALTGKFAFIRVDFTRQLETDLDAIALGKKSFGDVVRGMHDQLGRELVPFGGLPVAREAKPKPVAAVSAEGKAVKCPKCGKGMVRRTGPRGEFFGCTGFKEGCRGSCPIEAPRA